MKKVTTTLKDVPGLVSVQSRNIDVLAGEIQLEIHMQP
jgi:hypothetical protein